MAPLHESRLSKNDFPKHVCLVGIFLEIGAPSSIFQVPKTDLPKLSNVKMKVQTFCKKNISFAEKKTHHLKL
jgi:hypothetical protein